MPSGNVDKDHSRKLPPFLRETRAVVGFWWLIVPGGVLGVVAIVQVVRGARHQFWFWIALAMIALWLATCMRLRQVVKDRDALQGEVDDEHGPQAIASRLTGYIREMEYLRENIPPDNDGAGQATMDQLRWQGSLIHACEAISSELRRNASGFYPHWITNPEGVTGAPEGVPFSEWGTTFCECSMTQLREICDRLRDGHESMV